MGDLAGKWLEVWWSASPPIGALVGASTSVAVGIVRSLDDYSMMLETPEGEPLFIPRDQIRGARMLTTPEQEKANRLLRPAEPPDTQKTLLRPAGAPHGDPKRFLRSSRRR